MSLVGGEERQRTQGLNGSVRWQRTGMAGEIGRQSSGERGNRHTEGECMITGGTK